MLHYVAVDKCTFLQREEVIGTARRACNGQVMGTPKSDHLFLNSAVSSMDNIVFCMQGGTLKRQNRRSEVDSNALRDITAGHGQ